MALDAFPDKYYPVAFSATLLAEESEGLESLPIVKFSKSIYFGSELSGNILQQLDGCLVCRAPQLGTVV